MRGWGEEPSLWEGLGGLQGLLIKPHLHLAHNGVVSLLYELATSCVCALIYILHLETALLEVPPLETEDSLVLIHTKCLVEIEVVVRAYEIKFLWNERHATCDVATATENIAVLTLKILSMYVEWL